MSLGCQSDLSFNVAAQKLSHFAKVWLARQLLSYLTLHGTAARAGCYCNALLGLAEHIAFMHHNVLLP